MTIEKRGPKTDLHTHFAGTLPATELIAIGLRHNLTLDAPTAKFLGIVGPDFTAPGISLAALDTQQLSLLEAGLRLDPARQSLFGDLEQVYKNRSFVTKNPAVFADMLNAIAEGYAGQGVEYAELSMAGVIGNPALLETIHAVMPEIEARTGVKLRFLAALGRHADAEWNMDEVDRMKQCIKSPYVVGMDVMGHEKSPIRTMAAPLREIIGHAAENCPGFTVRIHAGENPYYATDPDKLDDWSFNNAYESIDIVDRARKAADGNPLGAYGGDIQIRVGHGRYGLHEKTLDLMRRTGCIAELCLSSNLLLNHTDGFLGPYNTYAGHGIFFVMGSDGYGMYSTSLPGEIDRARNAGMEDVAEADLELTENAILAYETKRFAAKTILWEQHCHDAAIKGQGSFEALKEVAYTTEDGRPRWTESVDTAKRENETQKYNGLVQSLNALGIETDQAALAKVMRGRRPVVFSGASKSSWKDVPEDQREKVRETVRHFLSELDGRKFVLVTGGTDYGFEAVVHKLAMERNESLPPARRLPVIGALTLEANAGEVAPNTISHAYVLTYGDGYAHTWMDQPSALFDMVEREQGVVIMAGGGQVIRDMIVDADIRKLIEKDQIALFEGIKGASGEKAPFYPQAAFGDAAGLKDRFMVYNDRFEMAAEPESSTLKTKTAQARHLKK